MAESRMLTQKGVCYLCGRWGRTEMHHIMSGTANRKISEQEGLKVNLCPDCHRRIHREPKWDQAVWLKKHAQEVWEKDYIKDYPYEKHAEIAARQEFIRLFGRSYL